MTQHLVTIHGTDSTGGPWYLPVFVDAATTEAARAEMIEALKALRAGGDPRGHGEIGGIWLVPEPKKQPTAAGQAALASIRAYGKPPTWKVAS